MSIPITTIVYNWADAIDFVFIAEWYNASSISQFNSHVTTLIDWLFLREPFKRYRNKFNIYSVPTISVDDGISRLWWFPNGLTAINKNTFWNTHSNHDGIQRLLYMNQNDYDNILKPFIRTNFNNKTLTLVVANDPMYAWWWQYTTDSHFTAIWLQSLATSSWLFVPLFIHELWHSFCNLADEYLNAAYVASNPWETYYYARVSWNVSISDTKDRRRDHLYTNPQYILWSVYDPSNYYRADTSNIMKTLSANLSSPNSHFNIIQQSTIRAEIIKRLSYNKTSITFKNNETIVNPLNKNTNLRIHSNVTIATNLRVKSIFVAEWTTLVIPSWINVQCLRVYNGWTINWLITLL